MKYLSLITLIAFVILALVLAYILLQQTLADTVIRVSNGGRAGSWRLETTEQTNGYIIKE